MEGVQYSSFSVCEGVAGVLFCFVLPESIVTGQGCEHCLATARAALRAPWLPCSSTPPAWSAGPPHLISVVFLPNIRQFLKNLFLSSLPSPCPSSSLPLSLSASLLSPIPPIPFPSFLLIMYDPACAPSHPQPPTNKTNCRKQRCDLLVMVHDCFSSV